MVGYYYIALVMILAQVVFLVQMFRNYHHSLSKYKKDRTSYRPKAVLIVPCKGRDLNFEKNITSFFNQDYENYLLWFVVADEADPAYSQLCRLKEQLSKSSMARDVQVLVAGQNDANVDLLGLVGADGLELAFLKHAQQLHL